MSNNQMISRIYGHVAEYSEWNFVGAIEEYEDCIDFIKHLRDAQANDVILINMNSPGGCVATGTMIVNAIRQCAARVICNVVYNSYSMAAIIALSCNELILQKHQFLMFHTYSGGSYGKSDDVIQEVNRNNKSIRGMWDEVMIPFFSRRELNTMHDGKDIYIHWDDPTLETRVKRHFK